MVILLAVGAVAVTAVGAWYWSRPASNPPSAVGTLSIETNPPGAVISIDGRVHGESPLSTALAPGQHTVEVAGITKRTLTVKIEPGARVAQYVELPKVIPPGRMRVESSPPGAQVTVDGTPRGLAPIDVEGLAAGAHLVTLTSGNASVTQRVTIEAGSSISLVVPMASPGVGQPGLVVVASPVELQIFEGDRLVGTSRSDQIMMLAGQHNLRLVNKELGFETTRAVQVTPGRTSTVKVDPPKGVLFVNAVPWAEVFVDGLKVGETPMANYELPVGSHEVVLRNPRFAEQRRTVVISLTAPARLGVDLRQ